MLPKSFSNWALPGVPWSTLTTTDAVSNTGYTVSLWPNGRVAYTTIRTFQRALSSSDPLSKRLSCYSINWSEIHTQMWHMLPLKSKEVHQALCIFFSCKWIKVQKLVFHFRGNIATWPKLLTLRNFTNVESLGGSTYILTYGMCSSDKSI